MLKSLFKKHLLNELGLFVWARSFSLLVLCSSSIGFAELPPPTTAPPVPCECICGEKENQVSPTTFTPAQLLKKACADAAKTANDALLEVNKCLRDQFKVGACIAFGGAAAGVACSATIVGAVALPTCAAAVAVGATALGKVGVEQLLGGGCLALRAAHTSAQNEANTICGAANNNGSCDPAVPGTCDEFQKKCNSDPNTTVAVCVNFGPQVGLACQCQITKGGICFDVLTGSRACKPPSTCKTTRPPGANEGWFTTYPWTCQD